MGLLVVCANLFATHGGGATAAVFAGNEPRWLRIEAVAALYVPAGAVAGDVEQFCVAADIGLHSF